MQPANFELLLSYIPYFETVDPDVACKWGGGEKREDGAFSILSLKRDVNNYNYIIRGGNSLMNIPQITSIDNALRIYYAYSEIGNKEIATLFGRLSSATIVKLKKLAKEEMMIKDEYSYGMYKVNTCIAYDIWGIDVVDLERRRKKLQALELQ